MSPNESFVGLLELDLRDIDAEECFVRRVVSAFNIIVDAMGLNLQGKRHEIMKKKNL